MVGVFESTGCQCSMLYLVDLIWIQRPLADDQKSSPSHEVGKMHEETAVSSAELDLEEFSPLTWSSDSDDVPLGMEEAKSSLQPVLGRIHSRRLVSNG